MYSVPQGYPSEIEIEYAEPRLVIDEWEKYFSRYICYACSHGATYIEAHRSIDGHVFLSSDISLSIDELHGFLSRFVGHETIMIQGFRTISKAEEDVNGIDYFGTADADRITASTIDQNNIELKRTIDTGRSLKKRIDANTKPEFTKYLLLRLTPKANCNVGEFCANVLASNYFNFHPNDGALDWATDKKLDLNICKNVEVQVHDKNSAIGTEVQTAISARVVDISMQHKHNQIFGQAKIFSYDVSSPSSSIIRPTKLILSGVHFSEFDTNNLAGFTEEGDSVKIYLFVNGENALKMLDMAPDDVKVLIQSCAIVEASSDMEEVETTAQSMSQFGFEESKEDIPPEDGDFKDNVTGGKNSLLRVGCRVVWTPKHDFRMSEHDNKVTSCTIQALRGDYCEVTELDYSRENGVMVYTTDDDPPLREVRIEAILILQVQYPVPYRRSPETISPALSSMINQADNNPLPAAPSNDEFRVLHTGLAKPRDWITDLILASYKVEEYKVNIVIHVETYKTEMAYLTLSQVTVKGAPDWLEYWIRNDSSFEYIHFAKRAGHIMDFNRHFIEVTVCHPRFDENKVSASFVI